MKTISSVTSVILGISLMAASGAIFANDKKAENESEANARGIEKSDIKRGMPIAKPKAQQAGDPIPGIDITVNQGHSVCESGSEDCDDGSAPAEHVVQQKAGVKLKGGKALAETVKSVDKGDDVKHIDEDSDGDGIPEQ